MPRLNTQPLKARSLTDGPQWYCYEIGPGESLDAFVVGPIVLVATHYVGRTVGCRRVLTRGAINCPLDKGKCLCQPKDTGYVPLRTADAEYVVVRLAPTLARYLTEYVRYGCKLRLTRPGRVRGRLRVDDMPSDVCSKMGFFNGVTQFDILDYLPRLWGDRLLMEYAKAPEEPKTLDPATTTTPARPSDNRLSSQSLKEILRNGKSSLGRPDSFGSEAGRSAEQPDGNRQPRS